MLLLMDVNNKYSIITKFCSCFLAVCLLGNFSSISCVCEHWAAIDPQQLLRTEPLQNELITLSACVF